jgi:hypothetical protein
MRVANRTAEGTPNRKDLVRILRVTGLTLWRL